MNTTKSKTPVRKKRPANRMEQHRAAKPERKTPVRNVRLHAVAKELYEAVLMMKSVMEAQGIFDRSEMLAINKGDAAIKSYQAIQ